MVIRSANQQSTCSSFLPMEGQRRRLSALPLPLPNREHPEAETRCAEPSLTTGIFFGQTLRNSLFPCLELFSHSLRPESILIPRSLFYSNPFLPSPRSSLPTPHFARSGSRFCFLVSFLLLSIITITLSSLVYHPLYPSLFPLVIAWIPRRAYRHISWHKYRLVHGNWKLRRVSLSRDAPGDLTLHEDFHFDLKQAPGCTCFSHYIMKHDFSNFLVVWQMYNQTDSFGMPQRSRPLESWLSCKQLFL